VGLIQDEESSLQAFQKEHEEENEKKDAAKSSNGTLSHNENSNIGSIVDKALEKVLNAVFAKFLNDSNYRLKHKEGLV
jgi:hypothetical protein